MGSSEKNKKTLNTFVFIAKNEGVAGHTDKSSVFDDLHDEYMNVYQSVLNNTLGRGEFMRQDAIKQAAKEKCCWGFVESAEATPFFPEEWDMGVNFPKEPGYDTNIEVGKAINKALKECYDVGFGTSFKDIQQSPSGRYTFFIAKARVAAKS